MFNIDREIDAGISSSVAARTQALFSPTRLEGGFFASTKIIGKMGRPRNAYIVWFQLPRELET
jgi:hypothetical protein